jgi:signal transduction histidine kinase
MSEPRPGLAAVRDLARSAQGAWEIGELLERICASVAGTFGFERVGISRYRPEREGLELLAAHGVSVDGVRRLSSSIDDWQIYRRALETRELVFVDDVAADEGLPPGVAEAYGVHSVAVLPLCSDGRCIGFLSADCGGRRFDLDDDAAALLETLGAVAASFLENALAHDELRRLDQLKSNFIALASHELRTPAAVIYGISSTLERRGDDLTEDQTVELRRVLHEQSERMRQLVEQLLDLSRLEAEAIRIRPEPIPVRDRIEELVATVAPEYAEGIELIVPPQLEAVADAGAFDRIVSNLITNAFRYGEPPVTVQAEQRDHHFRLAVEDRGRGVSPEFVPHLFERFTRSEQADNTVHGAGLGLSIAQSYAHAHGGDLLYATALPHGARFELVLPRLEAAVN